MIPFRDLVGYCDNPPNPHWPQGARIALQIVVNYEEGGERNIMYGDSASESLLHEIVGVEPWLGERNLPVESVYEYGARVGFWRVMQTLKEYEVPVSVFAVASALQRNPSVAAAVRESDHEVVGHGLRWIDYRNVEEDIERQHLRDAITIYEQVLGERPIGWYTGRCSPNTRRLVVEEGGFLYDSDAYNDDLPYWVDINARRHLIIPYTYDNNDQRFLSSNAFVTAEDFFVYLRDSFDRLYMEGATSPKMMSVGLHCRIIGRPGRIAALSRFLDYVNRFEQVWICRRSDIARHWLEVSG